METDGAGAPVLDPVGGESSWGALEYTLEEVNYFTQPLEVGSDIPLDSALATMMFEERFGTVRMKDFQFTISKFLAIRGEKFNKMLVLEKTEFDACRDHELPYRLRDVVLRRRIDKRLKGLLLAGLPKQSSLKHWRKKSGIATRAAPSREADASEETPGTRAMLELPKKRPSAEMDPERRVSGCVKIAPLNPLKMVNSVSFAVHLRSVEDFSEALEDARIFDEGDHLGEQPRDASNDPSKRTIFRAMRRMDLVGMAIERRLFHEEVEDDLVESITCYSDSSPVVRMELQGMLADACRKDGSRRRVVLPGGSIFY